MKTTKKKQGKIGLAALRSELGFNQELMAMYLKVNITTLKMAETGQRTLPTAALIRVAELEIKMAGESPKAAYEEMHLSEEPDPEIFRQHYRDLNLKEKTREYACVLLKRKLESTVAIYRRTRKRLEVIEAVMEENPAGGNDAGAWQRQKRTAVSMLQNAGLPMQALLNSKINMLDAEIQLFKKLKLQLSKAFEAFFKNDSKIIL